MPKSEVPHLPHSTQVPQVFVEMENQLTEAFQKKELRWAIFHRDREYANSLGDPQIGTVVVAATKDEAERKASGLYFLPSGAWAISEQHLPELGKEQPEESLQVQNDFGISF